MIELLRFLLALIVVQAHFWLSTGHWLAWQSVFGFFTLSGFLMTRVLNERYGFGARNFAAFAVSRLLRLWPAYLAVLALTTIALLIIPGASGVHRFLHLPRSFGETIANVTSTGLIGIRSEAVGPTLMIPTAWSLSVELLMYVLLAAYFAKSEKRLITLCCLGIASLTLSTGACLQPGAFNSGAYCFGDRYEVLEAGFIPVAIGGMLYFRRQQLSGMIRRWRLAIVGVFIAIQLACSQSLALQATIGPFIGCLIVGAIAVFPIRRVRPGAWLDFVGRASYHLFIAQWGIVAILVPLTPLKLQSFGLCATVLALSLALSLVLVPMENRIERLRRRLVPETGVRASGDFIAPAEPATS